VGFTRRVLAWYAERGINAQRLMTDKAWAPARRPRSSTSRRPVTRPDPQNPACASRRDVPTARRDHTVLDTAHAPHDGADHDPKRASVARGPRCRDSHLLEFDDRTAQWVLELVVRNGEQLAVVTSLPNMSTALRLVRQGRGDATVSETLNSNSINLVGGVIIPAAILGLGRIAADAEGDLLWLTVLTGRSLVALAHPRGMGRLAGLALVGGFVAFVVSHVV
jgi:hypothetical protein